MKKSFQKPFPLLLAVGLLIGMLAGCANTHHEFSTAEALPPTVVRATEPIRFAPYIYRLADTDVDGWIKTTGNKFLTLAFFNSDGGCGGSWPQNETDLIALAKKLRAIGGQVIVSSGGWNAPDLASHCLDPVAIADTYEGVLTRLGTNYLDIDAEPGDIHNNLNPVVVDRRSAALKLLQNRFEKQGKPLHISMTLAVRPAFGFDAENFYLLQSAKNAGVHFDVVNPMIMDYRDGTVAPYMGDRSIMALEKAVLLLKELLPGKTDAEYWAMMATTAMIGQNDAEPEIFTLSDAHKLVDFARAKGMARLSFWSLDRDNGGCPGERIANPTCSGIDQGLWEFSKILGAY
jgi:hypothetical protein